MISLFYISHQDILVECDTCIYTFYSACPHICQHKVLMTFMFHVKTVYGSPRWLDINFLTATRHVTEGFLKNMLSQKPCIALFGVKSIKCNLSIKHYMSDIDCVYYFCAAQSDSILNILYYCLWEHEQQILLVL